MSDEETNIYRIKGERLSDREWWSCNLIVVIDESGKVIKIIDEENWEP